MMTSDIFGAVERVESGVDGLSRGAMAAAGVREEKEDAATVR